MPRSVFVRLLLLFFVTGALFRIRLIPVAIQLPRDEVKGAGDRMELPSDPAEKRESPPQSPPKAPREIPKRSVTDFLVPPPAAGPESSSEPPATSFLRLDSTFGPVETATSSSLPVAESTPSAPPSPPPPPPTPTSDLQDVPIQSVLSPAQEEANTTLAAASASVATANINAFYALFSTDFQQNFSLSEFGSSFNQADIVALEPANPACIPVIDNVWAESCMMVVYQNGRKQKFKIYLHREEGVFKIYDSEGLN